MWSYRLWKALRFIYVYMYIYIYEGLSLNCYWQGKQETKLELVLFLKAISCATFW